MYIPDKKLQSCWRYQCVASAYLHDYDGNMSIYYGNINITLVDKYITHSYSYFRANKSINQVNCS